MIYSLKMPVTRIIFRNVLERLSVQIMAEMLAIHVSPSLRT